MAESKNIIINIGKKDVIWNYLATFLQVGSGIILFPVMLRMLSSEIIGIWAIFISISSLIRLLDFGFANSFTRNITYIFSGVNKLEKMGISNDYVVGNINYKLLSDTISAMKWFYSRIALLVFLLLITFGTLYVNHVLSKSFSGNITEIRVAWAIFCIVNTYSIYTLYYDSLIIGSGKVMKDKQIIIVGQLCYLFIAFIAISFGMGLLAIVLAQFISVLIRRFLSYRVFFTSDVKLVLEQSKSNSYIEIIKVLFSNSAKLGLTSIGAFLVLQSSVIVGSLYLSLSDIASYGITMQVINVIIGVSAVYYAAQIPKISYLRVNGNHVKLKEIYLRSFLILLITFLLGGAVTLLLGNQILILLKSKTLLLSTSMIIVLLVISLLEKNHAIAGGFLLSKNEVPFFKASLISGAITIILLFLFIGVFKWGVWGMILAPGIAQVMYQNWKWPLMLLKELT